MLFNTKLYKSICTKCEIKNETKLLTKYILNALALFLVFMMDASSLFFDFNEQD